MAASTSKAARNRSAAAKRAAAKTTTADTAGDVAKGSPDPVTPGGDPDTHQAHPENPQDSSVAHAPASGSQHAEGGYPSGEYDVTNPAFAPDGSRNANATPVVTAESRSTSSDPTTALLDHHFAQANSTQDELLKKAQADARLSDEQRMAVLEGVQVGFVLEHEAPNRWRTHVVGQPRFGHGATAVEAIEAFLLGSQGSAVEVAARAFAKMSAQQQQEIRDRDAAAAASGTVDATEFAREEALKVAQADKQAKPAALNAASDGAERASARDTLIGGKQDVVKGKGSNAPKVSKSAAKK